MSRERASATARTTDPSASASIYSHLFYLFFLTFFCLSLFFKGDWGKTLKNCFGNQTLPQPYLNTFPRFPQSRSTGAQLMKYIYIFFISLFPRGWVCSIPPIFKQSPPAAGSGQKAHRRLQSGLFFILSLTKRERFGPARRPSGDPTASDGAPTGSPARNTTGSFAAAEMRMRPCSGQKKK